MLTLQRAITSGQDDHQEEDEHVRDIHALTPPHPTPATRGRWETGSQRSSSLSVSSEAASSENFTTMSREFNALVLAGSSMDNNDGDTTSGGNQLSRIGEDEIPEETNPLAIVPDNSPLDTGPDARRFGPGPTASTGGGVGHGEVSVQRVKKEEVESKISAWQNAKIAKINNRFKREDAIINGWEFGYPLRLGEKECSYYLKTGQCKFGITCKFHHPQPAGTSMPASAPQFYPPVQSPSVPIPEQYGGQSSSLRVARPPLLPGSYVQGAYGPMLLPPGMVPIPGWGPYSAPVSPVPSPGAQPALGATSLYGVTQLTSSTSSVAGAYPSLPSSVGPSSSNQKEQTFPERPGEPECQYYLRTGDCKFGASCRYHHPRDRVPPRTNCFLSPLGLPLRPGVQICAFYLQNGYCKFGSTCKFDHPLGTMRYSPSGSSLVDMPVAPYPVGSLLATLAPSSTSSELRPELISGSKKDSYLSRIPSSGSSSSSSVGLIFSQTGSVPLADLQLSGQISVPLSSSRNTRQGGDIRHSS